MSTNKSKPIINYTKKNNCQPATLGSDDPITSAVAVELLGKPSATI